MRDNSLKHLIFSLLMVTALLVGCDTPSGAAADSDKAQAMKKPAITSHEFTLVYTGAVTGELYECG